LGHPIQQRDGASGPGGGELRRDLGLLDAIAIHVGNILGSGIYIAPAAVAAVAPGGLRAAGLWALGGIVAACGAACYAECGTRLPRSGGFYVFYREVFGEAVAFVGGWAALLVTYPASIAAIALLCGEYLGKAIPAAGDDPVIPAAGAVLLGAALNVVGVKAAARVQWLLTGIKVSVLAAVCVAAAAAAAGGGGAPSPPSSAGAAGVPLAALLGAVVVLLWTYDGWSDISLVSGEVREPGRVLGRAVLLGTGILVALYATVQICVAALLPGGRAAASARVVAEAVEAGLGAGSGRFVALLVAVSTFGAVHGVELTASRLGYAMARDGVFLRWFSRVDPRFGTPTRSVAALTAASLVYVFAAEFRNLLAFFSFTVWIFYGLTAVALAILRRRRVGETGAWRAPGGWIAPALILATAAGMTGSLLFESPSRSLTGLALLLAGFPVYAVWRVLGRRGSVRG
jgi:APA family basic amino acid/polyamine antiporter